MRFKHVFSIIGPVMVGPSSSHTAGAVRIGRVARQLLGCQPEEAEITLYGSFAETYSGHGTDLALVGGLLDFDTDDERIPEAFEEARKRGLRFSIKPGTGVMPHPNFAEITARAGGREASVQGASIGGGNIEIYSLNGFDTGCSGYYPTIAISHEDRVGVLASITATVSGAGLNIGFMNVSRKERSGDAMTVVESDRRPDDELLSALRGLPHIKSVSVIDVT
ncbi:L-serine ammonia-lyase, iron-sulfur-dependent subunit beta [Cohnella sp. AR92]|uniref:L-serine ammonia-lyase, iron-sulfur-dependent subunit beta n=1 Tax=Cohnella sp. AR92 TaxID=648716 RepID=UPI000F8DAB2E|nr:L-serine ammonia-lyase, iron-sulfur-dependent subunit beta [Cohnella sp. AR92]RUS45584.1 L-serine ammonia-lyase, iron-sulfur-dependent, subunit beta [Cohnella sp. AR92]